MSRSDWRILRRIDFAFGLLRTIGSDSSWLSGPELDRRSARYA